MQELLKLFFIFQKSLKILQTGKDMCSHLVLMLYNEIMTELEIAQQNVKSLSSLFAAAKSSFEKRVQIDEYYIVAAMMDPGQINLPIISSYCSKIDKTFLTVLSEVAGELGIESVQSTPDESEATSSDLLVKLI